MIQGKTIKSNLTIDLTLVLVGLPLDLELLKSIFPLPFLFCIEQIQNFSSWQPWETVEDFLSSRLVSWQLQHNLQAKPSNKGGQERSWHRAANSTKNKGVNGFLPPHHQDCKATWNSSLELQLFQTRLFIFYLEELMFQCNLHVHDNEWILFFIVVLLWS